MAKVKGNAPRKRRDTKDVKYSRSTPAFIDIQKRKIDKMNKTELQMFLVDIGTIILGKQKGVLSSKNFSYNFEMLNKTTVKKLLQIPIEKVKEIESYAKKRRPTVIKEAKEKASREATPAELFNENKGLVHNVIKTGMFKKPSWIEYKELYQIGLIALYKAAEKYEFDRNAMFSTYATKAILNEMIRQTRRLEKAYNRGYMVNDNTPSEQIKRVPFDNVGKNRIDYQEPVNYRTSKIDLSHKVLDILPKLKYQKGRKEKNIEMFKDYFGLQGRESLSFRALAEKHDMSANNAQIIISRMLRQIKEKLNE